MQAISNLTFAWLAIVGPQQWALTLAVTVEQFTGAIGTVIFVAYLSALCKNPLHTATQYALLTALPGAQEASKVAPTASNQYHLLNKTIREVFPGTLVAPGLMVAATDSVHYSELSDHIFKFSPVRANAEDLKRFHGTNERLSTSNYAEAIRFYYRPLSEGAKAPAP